jgi:hypothetical protein
VAARPDLVRTLYRTLLVFDAVAIIIILAGVVEFVYFEPPGQVSGAKAHVVGVFAYDPDQRTVSGPDRSIFARNEPFAAMVDWGSLPNNITVDARWVNSFGTVVGAVGPGTPAQLADERIVPVLVPPGLHLNLPGRYTFVVERYQGGVPVEVLARRVELVER